MISFDLNWKIWGLAVAFLFDYPDDKGVVIVIGPLSISIPGD